MQYVRIFGRSIRDAFKGVFRNLSLSMASILCTTITLIVVAISIVLTYNINNFTKLIESDMSIVVFLKKDISKEEVTTVENKIKEVTNLNKLYEKLALLLSNENKENNKDIYKKFEEELGRTLAPTEVTMIADLKENYSEELILYALKNAVINGARNLRYIDSTLKNWKTSGYKTKEDVENNQKKFKQERKPEIIDYDWLNES